MAVGRPKGSASTCSFCGEVGHSIARDGLSCSETHLAAQLVWDYGYSKPDAASEMGISRQSLYEYIARREAVS